MDRRLALAAALALLPAVAAASGGGEKKKGGGLSFVAIRAVAATIMRRDGSRGVITVECGVDVHDEKLRALAEMSQPRLRAAYAGFVQNYAAACPLRAYPTPTTWPSRCNASPTRRWERRAPSCCWARS
jgi:hypothetical protein